jgi:hypothetical protein
VRQGSESGRFPIVRRPSERNYGCRVSTDYSYRGLGTVVLENAKLRVSVLPDKGTDIFELLYKPLDIDFMYRSPSGIRNPATFVPTIANPGGAYLDFWEGGWQEAFPVGGWACNYKGAAFGLHGEVSLMPWQYSIVEDDAKCVAVYFWVRTCRSPFLLEKILSLHGEEPILRIWERITNEGQVDMDFMWGHHPVVGLPFLHEDCAVTVPAATVIIPDPSSWPASRLKEGTYFWPRVEDRSGRTIDISGMEPADAGIAEAAYLTDLREGWFTLTSQRHNLVFAMSWPHEIFPWVWYWKVAGGERAAPFFGRNYCVALEPFTSYPPHFEKVLAAGTQKTLAPQQSLEADLAVSIFPNQGKIRTVSAGGQILFDR